MEQVEVREKIVQTGSTDPSQKAYQQKKAIFRVHQVVWYILGVIEVLLAFRIVFKLLGANPSSDFVSFVYGLSEPFAQPFAGIFGITATQGSVIEWSTFVAMAVYAIVAYGIVKLLLIGKPTDKVEVSQSVDNQ